MNKYPQLALGMLLAACASQPHKIPTTVTAVSRYQNVDCATLTSDLEQATTSLYLLNDQQRKAATADAILVGVGLFIWPALLGVLATDDHGTEIARLKGEQSAMTQMVGQRCADAAR